MEIRVAVSQDGSVFHLAVFSSFQFSKIVLVINVSLSEPGEELCTKTSTCHTEKSKLLEFQNALIVVSDSFYDIFFPFVRSRIFSFTVFLGQVIVYKNMV